MLRIFPNASKSVIEANAHDYGPGTQEPEADPALQDPKPERNQAPALDRSDAGEKESLGRITVRFTLFRVKLLDPDNAAGSVKDCLDGCRQAGLIPDDQWHQIKLEIEQSRVLTYKSEKTDLEIIWP